MFSLHRNAVARDLEWYPQKCRRILLRICTKRVDEYERILRSENREEYQIDPGVATSLATKRAAMQIE